MVLSGTLGPQCSDGGGRRSPSVLGLGAVPAAAGGSGAEGVQTQCRGRPELGPAEHPGSVRGAPVRSLPAPGGTEPDPEGEREGDPQTGMFQTRS